MPMTRDEAAQVHAEASEVFANGDHQRAGDLYSSLLIEPEALDVSSEIQWNYAACLAHQGNWELAIQHVQASGYNEEDFRTMMAEHGGTEPRHDYLRAAELYEQGQWQAADDAFGHLLEHPDFDPNGRPELLWNMAMSAANQDQIDRALELVAAGGWDVEQFRDGARQSGVSFVQHDFQRASDAYSSGRHDEAADLFAWMLLDPDVPNDIADEIHWNVAMCQAHLGQWEPAFGHLDASSGDEQDFRSRLQSSGVEVPDRP